MKEQWWERPSCYLCDYWWAVLSAIILILTAYFTRGYWLPLIGIEDTPMVSATPNSPPSTSSPQYLDPGGGYSFSPPANAPAENAGGKAQQWALPDGVVMSVNSEPAAPGDTLATYAQEVTTRMPYDVASQSDTQIGGQPAIRQEVSFPGETKRAALGYLVLYDGKKYQIALAGLGEIPASEQDKLIQDFEKAMATFQFK